MKKSPFPEDSAFETKAAHLSLDPFGNHGMANPPVYHTSTVLSPTLDDYRNKRGRYDYGRVGTPTSEASEKAVAALYNADDAVSVSSGAAAIAAGVLAMVKNGDKALFPDSMYGSGRRFVERILPTIGVRAIFYPPTISGAELAAMTDETVSLIYIETPGSLTFEMQDTKAIIEVAKQYGAKVACDNTWGTALYFDAFGHGADLVIEAGTKFISGHSDVSIGYIIANGAIAEQVRNYTLYTGHCVAPDDHYLALRGLRTMAIRLKKSEENGLKIARWIETQKEVKAMLHPALESHPQHHLWKRDFTGSCGLFSFLIDGNISNEAVDDMVDNLQYYGIGASWGGCKSLITEDKYTRSVSPRADGRLLRIYTGIEDAQDLLSDIQEGFERMRRKI